MKSLLDQTNDDIIFGADDDIFGGGTDTSSINEGDIFIGGTEKTRVLVGKEEDYIFMVEDPGSNTYDAIELMLDQGNLSNQKLLIAQKAVDPTGYTYVQSEIIRFTNDGTWFTFDQDTGEISGSMMSEIITGSSLKTDKILGGAGNDILKGSGGQLDNFDIIKGGYGNDTSLQKVKIRRHQVVQIRISLKSPS